MCLITKTIDIGLTPQLAKYYKSLGYNIPKITDEFGRFNLSGVKINIKIEHLKHNSTLKVLVQCDNCGKIINEESGGVIYQKYNKYLREDGKYYCKKCANKLRDFDSFTKTKLKNGKSFEQWCIENNRQDILDRWDYDLNDLNPNDILFKSNRKYYFKCPTGIHDSELKTISNISIGKISCNKCNSLGTLFPKSLEVWSDKNEKSPYDYFSKSSKKVWWKCQDGIHDDFYRAIYSSTHLNFRCPECQYSKGEEKVSNWLIENNIYYIPQKTFDGLIGINNGLLSYDFYLPDYNLLIEYQGEQHEKYTKGLHACQEDFKKQQEHDSRKKQYAKYNNINLLEIWHYDFKNIERILENLCL